MTPLTRSLLGSREYFDRLQHSRHSSWTPASIRQSLEETMRLRPPSASRDVWIFAYGSLMWNPLLNFDRRETALLAGWHRSFCLHLVAGRATEDCPGRMLAVEPGGMTSGVALRLPEADLDEELPVVWTREMIFGSYRPRWTPITFANGTSVSAITFTACPEAWQYQPDSTVSVVAPLIRKATGPFGTNAEYLLKLKVALDECGMEDAYVSAIVSEIECPIGIAGA